MCKSAGSETGGGARLCGSGVPVGSTGLQHQLFRTAAPSPWLVRGGWSSPGAGKGSQVLLVSEVPKA